MQQPLDPIAVTGLGMVSSLGLNVVDACAAARAGLSRAAELPFQVIARETNDREPVVGHAIASLAGGFEGKGRILRILQLALADLVRNQDSALLASPRCRWYLILPESAGAPVVDDEERQRGPTGLRAPSSVPEADPGLVGLIGRVLGRKVEGQAVTVVRGEHAAFAAAFQQAAAVLAAQKAERCVIGAADSLVDAASLQRLYDQGRLKTTDDPANVMPGEAGAFVVIEPKRAALYRRVPVYGGVAAAAMGSEANPILSKKPAMGKGLIQALEGLALKENGGPAPWLISDHNGEPYRATEWGYALTHLTGRYPSFQEAAVTYPAISFGDTAGASGVVGLCMALRAFARGYAPSGRAVICSSSDGGARAALHVHTPERT